MTTTQGVILIILSSVLILSSAESLYSRACAGGDAPAACKKFCELCQTGCIPPGKTLATKTFMDVCDEEQQLKFDQEQKENTKICQEFMDGLTNGAASDAEKSKNINTKVGHNGNNSGLLDVWANADSMTVHTAILCVSIAAALWQLSGIHKKQAETLEEIGKLQVGKKNALEDEKNVLDGQKKALEDEKKAFGREKKALEDEKNALDGQKKALEEDKTALETKKSALKEKKKAFEEEKKAFESEKTKLEEEKKELGREKKALDTNKKALESEKTKLEEEKKALEDKNNNALKETSKDQKDVSEGHENAGKDQNLSNAPEDTAGNAKKDKDVAAKPNPRKKAK